MIPALERWTGDHAMTKDTTKAAAVAADIMLFDNWFDPIEDGVRARVRRRRWLAAGMAIASVR
jgi:hypothetical protein